jgi:hypothetical protein
MQIITPQTVKELIGSQSGEAAVTLYVPMQATVTPPHLTENQIRLKNLVAQAAEELVRSYGEDEPLVAELGDWLEAQLNDRKFWEQQTAGLLLCAREGSIRWFNLPVSCDEYVAVDESFHLAPILALLSGNRAYYILSIAQHQPHLYVGDSYGLRLCNIDLPGTITAALGIDEDNQKSENQGSASGSSMRTGWFNGRGGAKDPQEADRLKFFRIIDRLICSQTGDKLPLILAGTESEIAEYRSLSKYPVILTEAVNYGHADMDRKALHRQALAIIDNALAAPARRAAIEDYERMKGTNPQRTADDVEAIEAAIAEGRVDTLLAPLEDRTTDTVQEGFDSAVKITMSQDERSRLLNRLAMRVWQMSGNIVSLTAGEMPQGASLAARLRY